MSIVTYLLSNSAAAFVDIFVTSIESSLLIDSSSVEYYHNTAPVSSHINT